MSVYRFWLFAVTILSIIFFNAAGAEIHVEPNKRGTLIIVGGGDTPYAIQKRFTELAGGAGKARIAIFQMASTGDDEEAEEVLAEFKLLGAESVILNFDRKQAETEAMDVLLSGFTGYWFLGGDQNLLVASL
jgi:cyanophycinase